MILIIDDDQAVTASLALLLKQAGFASTTASSPDEAIEVLRRQPCQLVIQDMNFSRRTSGEEGLALLRADQGADAGAAGRADNGLGFDQPGRRGDEGGRRRLRHQAVDQRADARDGEDDARPGRVACQRRGARRVARRSRCALRFRLPGRPRSEDAARAAADRPRRRHPGVGADHRRERHRQGAGRRGAPPQQPPGQSRLRQGEPRRHLVIALRERDVRPRPRRLHRCPRRSQGPLRGGPRRHDLPRRDRRPRPGARR